MLIATALISATALTACAGHDPSGPDRNGIETVRYLQPSPSMVYLPAELAMAKDLFTANGVKLDRLADTANGVPALLSNNVDIAIVPTGSAYSAVAAGSQVRSLGVLTPGSANELVISKKTADRLAASGVTPDSPIKDRVQALRHLSLTAPQSGTSSNTLLRNTFKLYGVNPDKDVKIVPLADATANVNTLKSGRSDGFIFSPPVTSEAIAEGFGVSWIAFFKGEVPQFSTEYHQEILTTKKYIEQHRTAVTHFMTAMQEAFDLLKSDPTSCAASIKKEFFADTKDGTYTTAFTALTNLFSAGMTPDQKRFEATLGGLNSDRPEPIKVSFDQVYDTTFLTSQK